MFSIELELISVVSNPKGGNQALSLSESGVDTCLTFSCHLAKFVFLLKCSVFKEIRAYLRCGEPEGRKPNAASQNPGSMYS